MSALPNVGAPTKILECDTLTVAFAPEAAPGISPSAAGLPLVDRYPNYGRESPEAAISLSMESEVKE